MPSEPKSATPNYPGPVRCLIVMGVSGCGKSTLAEELAAELGWVFGEGDDFHPPANLAKMRAGQPLSDEDRWPWLEALQGWAGERLADSEGVVLSCSALKRSYRDLLRALPGTRFISLRGTPEELARRLEGRTGHFMPPGLLPSQLAALEDPSGEPDVLTLDLGPPAPALAREVGQRLGLPGLARRGPQGADP